MKVYVEAYGEDGRQILGNLDGQGVINAKNYKLTSWYRSLRWMYTIPRVAYYLIKNENGKTLERVEHELPEQK